MSDHAAPEGPLWKQALRGVAGIAAVLLVAALLGGTRFLPAHEGNGRPVFALGFILLGGMVMGHVAAMLRLPRLTGYLIAGVLAGPHVSGVVGPSDAHALELVNALALALIALQAGAEFTAEMLRKGLRTLFIHSLTQLAVLLPGMVLVFALVMPHLPMGQGASTSAVIALALVWAAMAVSKSPAAALAVTAETRAAGPLTSYTLGMVVAFDVAVLVVFALAMTVARSLLEPGASISLHDFAALGEELLASVAAGTTFGLLLAFWLWAVRAERTLFILVVAYAVTAFCRYFHYDTLLVFVTAGFVVQNFSRQGHALIAAATQLSSAVMVVFFATAGAHLDVEALKNAWQVALVLAVARILFTVAACAWGARLAGDAPVLKKYAWAPLVSQAGVTIGLVTVAAEKLPAQYSAGIQALGIAVVGLNELAGPVFFKWALGRAGELNQATAPPPE